VTVSFYEISIDEEENRATLSLSSPNLLGYGSTATVATGTIAPMTATVVGTTDDIGGITLGGGGLL